MSVTIQRAGIVGISVARRPRFGRGVAAKRVRWDADGDLEISSPEHAEPLCIAREDALSFAKALLEMVQERQQ